MKSYFGPYLNNPWLHGPFPLMHMVAGVPGIGAKGAGHGSQIPENEEGYKEETTCNWLPDT